MTSASQIRRFYRTVACHAEVDGVCLSLDARPARTPLGKALRVPTIALGERIAAEWNAQKDVIQPETMPVTQLACGVIDHIAGHRDAVVARIRSYAETDLLSYRAEQPADLAALQDAGWNPELEWAERAHGIRLMTTSGVTAISQPASSLAALEGLARRLDDWRLAVLMQATVATGSAILGLGLFHQRLSAAAAHDLAELDIAFQNALWGTDALEVKRLAALSATLHICAETLAALAAEQPL